MERLVKHTSVCPDNVHNVNGKRELDGMDKPNTPAKKTLLDNMIVKTNKSEAHNIDKIIARYVISSNSPFNTVENAFFKEIFTHLRPGYKPPSERTVSGDLLDIIYAEEVVKASQEFEGFPATLAVDGWSNITNDPVVGISITCNGKTALVDTIDTTGKPHTADYMCEVTLEGINKAETTFKVNVQHVVTDGAANMKSMREKVHTQKPELLTYHCQPHLLNLLAKDVQKLQRSTVSKIIAVLKYFRNKHAAIVKLQECNMNKPPLPSETRWNTLRDSLKYFCNNWAGLVSILEQLEKETAAERRFLEDLQVRRAATELLEIFDLIAEALNTLQCDKTTISTATESWLKLSESTQALQNPQVQAEVVKRREEAMNRECFLAANLLDNRYRGQRLTPAQVLKATEFIIKRDDSTRQPIAHYVAETGTYSTAVVNQEMDPVTFWKMGKKIGFDSNLCDVALQLSTAVCSSAGLERNFSTLKLTYGSLRTNFSVEKAGKLAFCYRTLNA